MSLKNRWFLGGIAALAIAIALWLGLRDEGDGEVIKYETAGVDRGTVTAKVTATGTLSALVTVQVGSQVSGRIQEIRADFNSQVKKGDVIAVIDPRLFEAAVEQARANLVAAQSNLTKANVRALEAERNLSRTRALAERKLVAEAEVDTAQATADAAKAEATAAKGEIARARASLHQAEINLAYTTIVSPIDGVVISRAVDVGQTVAASLQAPTLFTIAEDLSQMQVDTSVAEADVGKLTAGMPASFTVDAFPGERFEGEVRQIRNAPTTVQNVVTYNAVVNVANPELKLRPGMTANVSFIYAQRNEVLRVPNAAVRFRPPTALVEQLRATRSANTRSGGGPVGEAQAAPAAAAGNKSPEPVGSAATPSGDSPPGSPPTRSPSPELPAGMRTLWVLRNGKPAPVSVRLGASDGSLTEVLGGDLREGDQVIIDAPDGSSGPGGRPRGGFRRVL